MKRLIAATCGFVLTLSSLAAAQVFDNGTAISCERKGFINLRTDLDAKPDDPNAGKEKMTLVLPQNFSWTVTIPERAVKTGALKFVGSTASKQSGTGNISYYCP